MVLPAGLACCTELEQRRAELWRNKAAMVKGLCELYLLTPGVLAQPAVGTYQVGPLVPHVRNDFDFELHCWIALPAARVGN